MRTRKQKIAAIHVLMYRPGERRLQRSTDQRRDAIEKKHTQDCSGSKVPRSCTTVGRTDFAVQRARMTLHWECSQYRGAGDASTNTDPHYREAFANQCRCAQLAE